MGKLPKKSQLYFPHILVELPELAFGSLDAAHRLGQQLS